MREPIIAGKRGDVVMFDTARDAVRYLEPIEVENGEYEVYDRDGLVLVPSLDRSGGVVITPTTKHAGDELAALLRFSLQARERSGEGGRDWLRKDVTLSELVDALWISDRRAGQPKRLPSLARWFRQGRPPGR